MSNKERHPLEIAFGHPDKEPLMQEFGKPKISVEKRGNVTIEKRNYSQEHIDETFEKILVAVRGGNNALSEKDRIRRTAKILDRWTRFLQEKYNASYFISFEKAKELYQRQQAIEMAAGEFELSSVEIDRGARAAIAAQKESLTQWITYLTQQAHDGTNLFAVRFQALVFKSLISRPTNTFTPLPLHSGALLETQKRLMPYLDGTNTEEARKQLQAFEKIYVQRIKVLDAVALSLRDRSRPKDGKWLKFSNPEKIVEVLKDKGTNLCIRFTDWAESYCADGKEIRMYMTKNPDTGKYDIPRIVISFKPQLGKKPSIREMRGVVGADQEIELNTDIISIAEKEAGRYENGETYVKKARDMRMLSQVAKKMNATPPQSLSKLELRRLYQIDEPLEVFGRSSGVPNLKDILTRRKALDDAKTIFGVVATIANKITENTNAYIGPISRKLFERLATIDDSKVAAMRFYTDFPEGLITFKDAPLGIGPRTGKGLVDVIKSTVSASGKPMRVNSYIANKLEKQTFSVPDHEIIAKLVFLCPEQFGFPRGASIQNICDTAIKDFGLKPCPLEVGLQLRRNYTNQPEGESLIIATHPLRGLKDDGHVDFPEMLRVHCIDGIHWLDFSDSEFRRPKDRIGFLRT